MTSMSKFPEIRNETETKQPKFRTLQDTSTCTKSHHHPQLKEAFQKDEKYKKITIEKILGYDCNESI